MSDSVVDDGRQPGAYHQVMIVPGGDGSLANGIASGLYSRGLDVGVGDPGFAQQTVVVLLPNVSDRLQRVTDVARSGKRVVPVAVGAVDPESVPEDVSRLNWLSWRNDDPASSLDQLAGLCTGSVEEYRALEVLQARAEGWQAGGQRADDLPTSRKDLKKAVATVDQCDDVPQTVSEYVSAMFLATRKANRRRVRTVLMAAVVTVLFVFASINVAQHIQNANQRKALSYIAMSDSSMAPFAPGNAVQVVAYGYLTAKTGSTVDDHTKEQLVELLSQRWPSSRYFNTSTNKAVNGSVLADDGRLLWADGGGDVWIADSKTADSKTLASSVFAHFSDNPLYFIGANDDWSIVAVIDSQNTLIASRDSQIVRDDVPGATNVAVTESTVYAWSPDTVWILDAGTGHVVASHPGAVSTVGEVDGRIVAFVQDEAEFTLVDCRTGDIVDTVSNALGDGEVNNAAMNASGHVVFEGADGQLWAWTDIGLFPTGLGLIGRTTALALTSRDEVLYSTISQGNQFYDLANSQRNLPVCGMLSTTSFVLAPSEGEVICVYGGGDHQVWSLDEARPVAVVDNSTEQPKTSDRSSDGRLATSLDENGVLGLVADGQSADVDLRGSAMLGAQRLGGKPTTVAISPSRQVVAGAVDGSVVIYDVLDGPSLRAARTWTSPDRSPIVAIAFSGGNIQVSTLTATWTVPGCVGCSTNFPTLLSEVQRRALPCYPSYILTNVPADAMDALGFKVCEN